MNENRFSGNPADWAFWAITVDGVGFVSFAPLTGEFSAPEGAASTMIRVATEGLTERVEWVFEIPKKWKTRDIIKRLSTFGFKQDEKAHHLLQACLEYGYLSKDEEEEGDDEPINWEDLERNPKDPNLMLPCYCVKCGGVTPGKIVCWNTKCCPQCSDNYEPTVQWDRLEMTKEEVMAFKPTKFKKGKF